MASFGSSDITNSLEGSRGNEGLISGGTKLNSIFISAEVNFTKPNTSGVPATTTTTTLFTTFIHTSSVPSTSVADHAVLGAGPCTEVPSPPKITFEKEELETTPEHTTTP
ncbi:hypothetical protein Tco_0535212 [Tanacetum coccineum]